MLSDLREGSEFSVSANRRWVVEDCSDPGESLCLAGGQHGSMLATIGPGVRNCLEREWWNRPRAAEGPIPARCLLLESAGMSTHTAGLDGNPTPHTR